MTQLEGGKRDRMVAESLKLFVEDGMALLGWFTTNPHHPTPEVLSHPMPDSREITGIKVYVSTEDIDYEDMETGSNLQRGSRAFIIDVFVDDKIRFADAVALHLRGDISAMLRGQFPSIGYDQAKLPLWNLQLATPVVVARMDIVDVRDDRSRGLIQEWEREWLTVAFVLEDEPWGL